MKYQIKDIKDFPAYRIDTNGDVWSCWKQKGISIKGKIGFQGTRSVLSTKWKKMRRDKATYYLSVELRKNKNSYKKNIHRLLAQMFIPNPKNKPLVCHKNGNPRDNRIENLYWGTVQENASDRAKHGTENCGGKNNKAKLNDMKVKVIRHAFNFGVSRDFLIDFFKLDRSTINRVISRKTWKHISST